MALFQRARSFGTSHPSERLPRQPAAVVPVHDPAEATRALIWNLEIGGWTEREAGNLVGLLHGLRPALTGWSEREIEHLRFLRAIVRSGRLDA
jgi:hypothetical protein